MVEETLSQAHRIKNFMGIIGDRVRRFCDQTAHVVDRESQVDLYAIRDDLEKIYSDMVVFLGAIRPRPLRIEAVPIGRLLDRIVFVASTRASGVEVSCDYPQDLNPTCE